MNKSTIFCLLLGVLSALLHLEPASAEEQDVSSMTEKLADWDVQVGGGIDFYSKYIWRGQNLVDEPVLQPSAYIVIENFTASFWGSHTLTDDKEWTEYDYTLDYSRSLDFISPKLEKFGLSVGYIYYDFPNLSNDDNSQEVYAAVAADTLLSPSFAVYHDFDEGDGTYYELAVSHSMPVDKLSLNLSAAVGYNDGQWDYDPSFSSATLGANLTFPFGEKVTFEPGIFYSIALDSQYDDEFYGGFSIAFQLWD